MDRKNDDSRLLLEQVNDLLENNKVLELRELLEEYHTMDILDVMENLDEEMKSLIKWYNEDNSHPIEKSAKLHSIFVKILNTNKYIQIISKDIMCLLS